MSLNQKLPATYHKLDKFLCTSLKINGRILFLLQLHVPGSFGCSSGFGLSVHLIETNLILTVPPSYMRFEQDRPNSDKDQSMISNWIIS